MRDVRGSHCALTSDKLAARTRLTCLAVTKGLQRRCAAPWQCARAMLGCARPPCQIVHALRCDERAPTLLTEVGAMPVCANEWTLAVGAACRFDFGLRFSSLVALIWQALAARENGWSAEIDSM